MTSQKEPKKFRRPPTGWGGSTQGLSGFFYFYCWAKGDARHRDTNAGPEAAPNTNWGEKEKALCTWGWKSWCWRVGGGWGMGGTNRGPWARTPNPKLKSAKIVTNWPKSSKIGQNRQKSKSNNFEIDPALAYFLA